MAEVCGGGGAWGIVLSLVYSYSLACVRCARACYVVIGFTGVEGFRNDSEVAGPNAQYLSTL